jgi:hypothetical protein
MRERLASTTASSQPISTAAFLCLLAGGCAIGFEPIFVRLADTGPVVNSALLVNLAPVSSRRECSMLSE